MLYVNSKCEIPPCCEGGIFEQRLASYRESIVRDVGHQSPVSYDHFVAFYSGHKKAVYQRAVDGLVVKPFHPRDATLKTFVKAEKLNLSIKPDPVPRVIQPRSPRYNVELGRYLRPVEKKIYGAIDNLFESPTIMSSYNSYEQAKHIKAKWDSFLEPVCVGMDASRFDQHVSVEALRFEHKLYDLLFKDPKLRELLRLQLYNVGYASASDGWFSYSKEGSRMSGDMNTSLGNKLLMCLMAKDYIDQLGFDVGFVNNGDDCLLICEKKNLSKLGGLHSWFLRYGFNIVREPPVFELEKIEFCQTSPILGSGVYRMVRNYKTCIAKDLTCINLGDDEQGYRCWLRDVADCGLTTMMDIPVMGAFYKMMKRIGVEGGYNAGADMVWLREFVKTCKTPTDIVSPASRLSFYISTGLIPDEQEALEKSFNEYTWGDNNRQIINQINYLFNDRT